MHGKNIGGPTNGIEVGTPPVGIKTEYSLGLHMYYSGRVAHVCLYYS